MLGLLDDMRNRRLDAFSRAKGLSSKELLQEMEDATTVSDIDTLGEARGMLGDFERTVLDLYVDVWGSFSSGRRCSVCGMTEKQCAEIGYDCVSEC